MQDSNPAPAPTNGVPQKPAQALRALYLPAVVGGAILGNQIISNTWACAIIPATIIAWLAAFFANSTVPALRGIDPRSQRRRIVSALLLGVLAGAVYPSWSRIAFIECFQTSPPDGVSNLHVIAKHYEGATEHTLIFDFNASPGVVRELLESGGFRNTGQHIERWRNAGGDWQALGDVLVGDRPLGFSERSFQRLTPPRDYQVFESEPKLLVWYVLIWDNANNRVLVFNILG